uniref:Uncharacterized protein n=1 Tax=Rhizophora mucronata TaxID=61149 RepID=A0A2P2MDH6_RHIMU
MLPYSYASGINLGLQVLNLQPFSLFFLSIARLLVCAQWRVVVASLWM